MFYAIIIPPTFEPQDGEKLEPEDLIFDDIKQAHSALKKYKGARMKTFVLKEKALDFIKSPDMDESFIEDTSSLDIAASFERLSITKRETTDTEVPEVFSTPQPGMLTQLRRNIESGNYEEVEQTVLSNPKYLVTVCDSAVYLMAGPKYNACHIAARANKPDIMALLLDTISNINFVKKLYPDEADNNIQDRVNHLLDSYLNTPDPRQGNTPLHFACKSGNYRVVRVLLTFEGCDLSLKDSAGKTAEESICLQNDGGDSTIKQKIKDMFKSQLHLPLYRDQLKKRLLLAKRRRSKKALDGDSEFDSDNSFSDDSFIFSPIKKPPGH